MLDLPADPPTPETPALDVLQGSQAPRLRVTDHAIALAVTSESSAGRVYNIAEPDPYTEVERAAKIGAVVGWHGRVIVVLRHQAPRHLILPCKFEQHLSWIRRVFSESLHTLNLFR